MGPLMLDCQAERLLPEEREKLAHPVVGGVILFSRNYYDGEQLTQLVKEIRESANKPLLIAVDHEGGRVQRFRDGFTALPAMGELTALVDAHTAGKEYDRTAIDKTNQANVNDATLALAKACGTIMAHELKQIGIDFSFAPVLDINGVSKVIGDRAFAETAEKVIPLASALIEGLQVANMPAIGKHFPGHGSVAPDSHVALPIDERALEEIKQTDMVVFERLISKQLLDGVMPAHVIYSQVDSKPAGFSEHWLQKILKQDLGFNGAVFSDDLSMHGASVAGNYVDRAMAALSAGCHMVLACNNPKGAESIVDALPHSTNSFEALTSLYGRKPAVHASAAYKNALKVLSRYGIG
ncbi:beta-N-acetylhexosaminidase [Alteromonas sp. MMG017]|uniref:beta-N-acetylhexosaminidase n=1 Tax=Alteromonas sp. MMG017 TaxID=2822692 RepID=UPI001B3A4E62|nr:beta-N-acetylhexosaminidase [Alteromonas sp. MMG017]MBQ4828148.1 beta-N-acetylhexosaminidase [Alteromonas sp. MMG017]